MRLYKKFINQRDCLKRDLQNTSDKILKAYITGQIDRLNIILPDLYLYEKKNQIKIPRSIERESY